MRIKMLVTWGIFLSASKYDVTSPKACTSCVEKNALVRREISAANTGDNGNSSILATVPIVSEGREADVASRSVGKF